MLDKLTRAFGALRKDVAAVKSQVERIEKVRPIVTEGKPGKDAISPKIEDIVEAVLAQIPTPKDGESPDPKAIVADVLAVMPKPRDGRDADPVNVSDVAAIVLAKIPKPKDGHNGPDLETVVSRVKAQVQDGRPGLQGKPGLPGKPGKNGVSITDVKLDNNNELFVFLDGKRKKAGKIRLPAASAPFNPGNAGGGGSTRGQTSLSNIIEVFSVNDLPSPVLVGGVMTIVPEARHYRINKEVLSPYPLAWPGAGKTTTFVSVNRSAWIYTGTDSCFRDVDAEGNFNIQGLTEWQAPNGDMWDVTSVTTAFNFQAIDGPRFTNFNALGSLMAAGGSDFELVFGTISNFNQGLTSSGSIFFEVSTMLVFGNNQVGCIYFTIEGAGTSGSVNFPANTFTLGSNETAFDFKTEIQDSIDSIIIVHNQVEGPMDGVIFAPGSLTQKSLKVTSAANTFIPDSKRIGSGFVVGNVNATTIPVSGTFVDFDFGTLLAGSNIERFELTNAVTGEFTYRGLTTFSGGISASFSSISTGGSRVFRIRFVKNGAVLPDPVESKVELGTTLDSTAFIAPLILNTGDTIRPQVTRVDGTSTITVEDYSVNVSSS